MKSLFYSGVTILVITIFLALNSVCFAQEVKVVNKVTLEPIKDVFVYVNSKSFYESTNVDGKVNLVGIHPTDTIFFQHPSFVLEFKVAQNLINKGNTVFLTQKVVLIEEVIIAASKSPEIISEVGNQVEIISKNDIIFRNPQTTADLLAQSGEVFVQKSQLGGGSPVLRGFEANSVLLVVDGVRLNNAIYRSGHLQNAITIDPTILERTEVVFGPGSVMYGSDAIGGVMHFVTQDPYLAAVDENLNFKFNGFTRYSSANKEKTIGGNLNFGWQKWGTLTAFSYNQYEDLRMGANRGFSPEDWGLLKYYVDRIDGKDTIVENTNPLIQKFSGYSQWNVLQKIKVQATDNLTFGINFQASSSSNIFSWTVGGEAEGTIRSRPHPTRTRCAVLNTVHFLTCQQKGTNVYSAWRWCANRNHGNPDMYCHKDVPVDMQKMSLAHHQPGMLLSLLLVDRTHHQYFRELGFGMGMDIAVSWFPFPPTSPLSQKPWAHPKKKETTIYLAASSARCCASFPASCILCLASSMPSPIRLPV